MSSLTRHAELAGSLASIDAALGQPLPIETIVTPLPVTETNPVNPAPVFCPKQSTHAVAVITNLSSIILLENIDRRRMILYNDSGAAIFVMFGPSASVSAFSFRLTPNEVFQGPVGCYTGAVSAIRASGTGNLQVTEIIAV